MRNNILTIDLIKQRFSKKKAQEIISSANKEISKNKTKNNNKLK